MMAKKDSGVKTLPTDIKFATAANRGYTQGGISGTLNKS